jgi:ABC-type uncharacterized transport system permease subunit
MTVLAHLVAAGLYAIGAAVTIGGPLRGHSALPWLLALGAAGHLLGILGLHLEQPPVALESTAAALSLIGWLVVACYLLSLRLVRASRVGAWVALTAFLLTLGAGLGLRFPSAAPSPGSAGAWPHAHVVLSAAGFALLALSGIAGLAYLSKERALKRRPPLRIELPSLESLDRLEHLGLALGFPLLTLGVLSGYAWALSRGEDPWSRHAVFLLFAWFVFLLPVTLRMLRHEQGPRPSRSVVLGFLVLAFSYLGVRLLGGAA